MNDLMSAIRRKRNEAIERDQAEALELDRVDALIEQDRQSRKTSAQIYEESFFEDDLRAQVKSTTALAYRGGRVEWDEYDEALAERREMLD